MNLNIGVAYWRSKKRMRNLKHRKPLLVISLLHGVWEVIFKGEERYLDWLQLHKSAGYDLWYAMTLLDRSATPTSRTPVMEVLCTIWLWQVLCQRRSRCSRTQVTRYTVLNTEEIPGRDGKLGCRGLLFALGACWPWFSAAVW